MEHELRLLRKDQYVYLEQVLILPNNTKLPKIATVHPQSLYSKDIKKRQVIQNMGTAVKVTLAATKFLKKLGNFKSETLLESINSKEEKDEVLSLEKYQKVGHTPLTEKEKQEMVELRTNLYKLTQKKELTKKEKQQKENYQQRLKILEQKQAEHV